MDLNDLKFGKGNLKSLDDSYDGDIKSDFTFRQQFSFKCCIDKTNLNRLFQSYPTRQVGTEQAISIYVNMMLSRHYDSRVVSYDRRAFIRLATNQSLCPT